MYMLIAVLAALQDVGCALATCIYSFTRPFRSTDTRYSPRPPLIRKLRVGHFRRTEELAKECVAKDHRRAQDCLLYSGQDDGENDRGTVGVGWGGRWRRAGVSSFSCRFD